MSAAAGAVAKQHAAEQATGRTCGTGGLDVERDSAPPLDTTSSIW